MTPPPDRCLTGAATSLPPQSAPTMARLQRGPKVRDVRRTGACVPTARALLGRSRTPSDAAWWGRLPTAFGVMTCGLRCTMRAGCEQCAASPSKQPRAWSTSATDIGRIGRTPRLLHVSACRLHGSDAVWCMLRGSCRLDSPVPPAIRVTSLLSGAASLPMMDGGSQETHLWNQASTRMPRRLPRCRLSAVGSKPQ